MPNSASPPSVDTWGLLSPGNHFAPHPVNIGNGVLPTYSPSMTALHRLLTQEQGATKAKFGKPENITSPHLRAPHSPEPRSLAPQPPWGPVSRTRSRNAIGVGAAGPAHPLGAVGPGRRSSSEPWFPPGQNGARAPGAASGSERGRRASAKAWEGVQPQPTAPR